MSLRSGEHRDRPAPRAAFTLWELLLALALSSVILLALAGAIDLHLRLLEKGRGDVEQAQLARAVLRRMADDLRGAVRYEPIDAEAMVGGAAASQVPDEDAAEEEGGAQTPDALEPIAEAAEDSEAAPSTRPPQSKPGVYGSQNALQVDVSRLPRWDECQGVPGSLGLGPVATDVKTVSWFVRDGPAAEAGIGSDLTQAGGLIRVEIDRAAAMWAMTQGGMPLDQDLPPVAPEALAVEFSYFDGFEWRLDWDTEAQGGLPVAVRIDLALSDPQAGPGGEPAAGDPLQWYTLVVRLPAAKPISEPPAAAEEESPDDEAAAEADSPEAPPGNSQPPGGGA
jgi:hypothetical protein